MQFLTEKAPEKIKKWTNKASDAMSEKYKNAKKAMKESNYLEKKRQEAIGIFQEYAAILANIRDELQNKKDPRFFKDEEGRKTWTKVLSFIALFESSYQLKDKNLDKIQEFNTGISDKIETFLNNSLPYKEPFEETLQELIKKLLVFNTELYSSEVISPDHSNLVFPPAQGDIQENIDHKNENEEPESEHPIEASADLTHLPISNLPIPATIDNNEEKNEQKHENEVSVISQPLVESVREIEESLNEHSEEEKAIIEPVMTTATLKNEEAPVVTTTTLEHQEEKHEELKREELEDEEPLQFPLFNQSSPEDLLQKIKRLEEKNQILEETTQIFRQTTQKFSNVHQLLHQEKQELQGIIELLEKRNKKFMEENQILQEAKQISQERNQISQKSIQILQEENLKLKERNKILQEENQKKDLCINELTSENLAMRVDFEEERQAMLKSFEQDKENLKSDIKALDNKVKALLMSMHQTLHSVSNDPKLRDKLNKWREKYESEIEQMQKALNSAKKLSEIRLQREKNYEEKMNQYKEELEQHKKSNEPLAHENAEEPDELSSEEKHEDSNQSSKGSCTVCPNYEVHIIHLDAYREHLEKEQEDLKRRIHTFEDDLITMYTMNDELIEESKKFQDDLRAQFNEKALQAMPIQWMNLEKSRIRYQFLKNGDVIENLKRAQKSHYSKSNFEVMNKESKASESQQNYAHNPNITWNHNSNQVVSKEKLSGVSVSVYKDHVDEMHQKQKKNTK